MAGPRPPDERGTAPNKRGIDDRGLDGGWPNPDAPYKKLLRLDFSRLNERALLGQKLLAPRTDLSGALQLAGRDKAALYAVGKSADDFDKRRTPLVLVHGFEGSPRDLQHVANALYGRRHQLYVLCFNAGIFRRPEDTGADLFEELRDKLIGGSKVVLVAHSIGASSRGWRSASFPAEL